ncbi:MAG: penicillin-binding protein 1C, partial [Bacteroidota bacterium]|nr:penicillin-binding protein 1C [Bacteroidota bacterium]
AGARSVPWFVLPPAMEYYYAQKHPHYRPLPPWRTGDQPFENAASMEMIYPEHGAHILIPIKLDGAFGKLVLQAAHRDARAKLHWDVNGSHYGTTSGEHVFPIDLPVGIHRLTLTDDLGNTLTTVFQVDRATLPIP